MTFLRLCLSNILSRGWEKELVTSPAWLSFVTALSHGYAHVAQCLGTLLWTAQHPTLLWRGLCLWLGVFCRAPCGVSRGQGWSFGAPCCTVKQDFSVNMTVDSRVVPFVESELHFHHPSTWASLLPSCLSCSFILSLESLASCDIRDQSVHLTPS